MGFSYERIFTNICRVNSFWYFDSVELSVQNGNLTVDNLFIGNIFIGHVNGTGGSLVVVTVMDPSYVSAPTSVTSTSSSVSQVLDAATFMNSSSSVWYFDVASLRTYVKVLVSGASSFTLDFTGATIGPGPGPGPILPYGGIIAAEDSHVVAHAGGSDSGSINYIWAFTNSITLSSLTFQGNESSWLQAGWLPAVLTFHNVTSVSFNVSVPFGTTGQYTEYALSTFTYQGGVQSIRSKIVITVGEGGDFVSQFISGWYWFVSSLLGGLDFVWSWILANQFVAALSGSAALMAISVTAVVVRRRRLRR